MRTKQSSTASELHCSSESYLPSPSLPAVHRARRRPADATPLYPSCWRQWSQACSSAPDLCGPPLAVPAIAVAAVAGDGLLHDASNLISALSLYCDLLLMPHVLKPEHRHYADEVRLLGTRSAAMIEQLMEDRIPASQPQDPERNCIALPSKAPSQRRSTARAAVPGPPPEAISLVAAAPVSLGSIVQRCSGLLSRVAGGRSVEVSYGEAAAVPIQIPAESIERILANLVRNAARALDRDPNRVPGRSLNLCPDREPDGAAKRATKRDGPQPPALRRAAYAAMPPAQSRGRGAATSEPMRETLRGSHAAIRIGVGVPAHRAGDLRPSPFRQVRLVVEDSGCGMGPGELDRLLVGSRAPAARAKHGIGFRVVRHLVDVSGGELSVSSVPGLGTTVQIAWPLAPPSAASGDEGIYVLGGARTGAPSRVSHDERYTAQSALNSFAVPLTLQAQRMWTGADASAGARSSCKPARWQTSRGQITRGQTTRDQTTRS